jgi:hypothetical protein
MRALQRRLAAAGDSLALKQSETHPTLSFPPFLQMEARLAAEVASAAARESVAVKSAEEHAILLDSAVRERAAAEQALKQQMVSGGCVLPQLSLYAKSSPWSRKLNVGVAPTACSSRETRGRGASAEAAAGEMRLCVTSRLLQYKF